MGSKTINFGHGTWAVGRGVSIFLGASLLISEKGASVWVIGRQMKARLKLFLQLHSLQLLKGRDFERSMEESSCRPILR